MWRHKDSRDDVVIGRPPFLYEGLSALQSLVVSPVLFLQYPARRRPWSQRVRWQGRRREHEEGPEEDACEQHAIARVASNDRHGRRRDELARRGGRREEVKHALSGEGAKHEKASMLVPTRSGSEAQIRRLLQGYPLIPPRLSNRFTPALLLILPARRVGRGVPLHLATILQTLHTNKGRSPSSWRRLFCTLRCTLLELTRDYFRGHCLENRWL